MLFTANSAFDYCDYALVGFNLNKCMFGTALGLCAFLYFALGQLTCNVQKTAGAAKILSVYSGPDTV